jgi:hypothetical protein
MPFEEGQKLNVPQETVVDIFRNSDEPESERIDTVLLDMGGPLELVAYEPDTWKVVDSCVLMCDVDWLIKALETAKQQRGQ